MSRRNATSTTTFQRYTHGLSPGCVRSSTTDQNAAHAPETASPAPADSEPRGQHDRSDVEDRDIHVGTGSEVRRGDSGDDDQARGDDEPLREPVEPVAESPQDPAGQSDVGSDGRSGMIRWRANRPSGAFAGAAQCLTTSRSAVALRQVSSARVPTLTAERYRSGRPRERTHPTQEVWMLRAIVFVCGAALMALELVAARVLAPALGNSIFVWGSVISTVMLALSLGYWVGGQLADRVSAARALSPLIAGAGLLTVLAPLIAVATLPWAGELGPRLGSLAASAAIFFLPALLLATVSPLAVRLVASDGLDRIGRSAGSLYAISTAGSIAGTLATAFWLIPALSLTPLIVAIGFTLFGCALAALALPRLTKASEGGAGGAGDGAAAGVSAGRGGARDRARGRDRRRRRARPRRAGLGDQRARRASALPSGHAVSPHHRHRGRQRPPPAVRRHEPVRDRPDRRLPVHHRLPELLRPGARDQARRETRARPGDGRRRDHQALVARLPGHDDRQRRDRPRGGRRRLALLRTARRRAARRVHDRRAALRPDHRQDLRRGHRRRLLRRLAPLPPHDERVPAAK